jgi:CRP/FNR family transcriptional regulator
MAEKPAHEEHTLVRRAPTSAAELRTACASCKLRELCLTGMMTDEELAGIDELVETRRRVPRGEVLFARGDTFDALYAVRTGFFKTRIMVPEGRDQVTGFQMAGELLGLDGVANDEHEVDAIALEDSEVCTIPYHELERLARVSQPLQRQLHRVMSREIVRDHGVMLLLGGMKADARVAALLVNLSRRFKARGYAADQFQLRATREEMGSYLGLTLETVSRAFKRLQDSGLISISGRETRLLDLPRLEGMTAPSDVN